MAEENESEQSGTPGRPAVKLGVKKLTAIIVAVVVVALAGIGGGYAYWTHHEGNAYREAVAQAENADKALSKAVEEATATTYKADQLKEPKLLDKLDAAIRKAKALKGVPNDAPQRVAGVAARFREEGQCHGCGRGQCPSEGAQCRAQGRQGQQAGEGAGRREGPAQAGY